MSADTILAQELKSLQGELATSQNERAAISTRADSPPSAQPRPQPTQETPEERELRDQLRELASEATGFFENAQKNISAHPAESVFGALLVGILIGRLIGRR